MNRLPSVIITAPPPATALPSPHPNFPDIELDEFGATSDKNKFENDFHAAHLDNSKYLSEYYYTRRGSNTKSSTSAPILVTAAQRQRRPSRFSLRPSVHLGSVAVEENLSAAEAYHYDAISPNLTFSQKSAERDRRVSQIMEDGVRTAAAAAVRSASLDGSVREEDEAAVRAAAGLLPKRMTYFLLALLCMTSFCLSMMTSLIAPFFPSEVIQKGGSSFLSGAILSCFDGTRFILAPFFGHYVYAIGARFMLIAGPFIAAWCTILFGLNGMTPAGLTFFLLAAVVRITSAFGSTMYGITSVSVRPVLFAGFFGLAFSLLRASITLGVIIGPAIGGALYAVGGFGLPFYVLGGFSMCLTAVQAWAIPDLKRLENAAKVSKQIEKAEDGEADGDLRPLKIANGFKQPSFWAICKSRRILFCMFMYCSFGFTTTFFSTNISLHVAPLVGSVARVGYIILIAGVAEVLVSPVVGYALDRGVSAKLTVVIGYALCTVGLLVMGPTPLIPFLNPSVWMVIIGTGIYGLGIGFGFTAPYNLATRAALSCGFPPNQQTFGLLAGCMQTFFTFGCFLGPLTGGAMHDVLGFPWSATIVAAYLIFMMMLSIGSSLILYIRDKRKLRSLVTPVDATHGD